MIRAIRNEPFLWIAGVGFVVIIVSGLLPLDRATHVLWLFIVDSAVIAAAVGIQLVLQRKWASSAMRLEMGTTAIFLMAGFALFLLQGVLAGCLVAGSTLIAGLVARRRVRCDTCLPQCGDGPSVILAISVAAVGSAIALPLHWWSEPGRWLAGSPFAISLLVICAAAVSMKLWGLSYRPRRDRLGLLVSLLVIGIFAYLSLSTDQLSSLQAFYHWSFYVGPAEMVRTGRSLLWEVPSQYGFGSVLAIAWLPIPSTWESLYVLSALMTFMQSLAVFFVIRDKNGGAVDALISGALTAAAIFLRRGLALEFRGPSVFPSTGGLRFGWCVMLVALVVFAVRRYKDARIPLWLLVGGCVLWLMGVLWSVESAAYCSAAWLPAYFLLAYRRQGRTRARSVGAILLPFVLILTLAFGLFLWYDNTLGHGPDVAAFVDYARAYGAGFGSLPLDAAGAMWILLFPLALLVAAMLKQASIESNDLPPLVAAFALVWITSTYFFGRSHPNNVLNLSAISCMGVFIALRHGLQQAVFARIAIAPFLTILLLASFGGEAYPLRHLVDAPPTHFWDVAAEFPRVDGSLAKLMKKADVRPGDPLVYVANRNESTAMPLWSLPKNAGRQVSENPPWIPAVPFDEIDLLPPTVRSKYFSRYIARARLSGWLVEANDTLPNDQWLREQLAGSYRVTRQYDNNSWRVTWYEYAGSSAS